MKILQLTTTIIFSLLVFSINAQDTRKGVLDNGLTYYIYQSKQIPDKAGFFLLQKTGSLVEQEEERGLAHFLEHMCFNGSKNFPDRTKIELFESKGLTESINAHTEMEKTLYKITNVPVNDSHLIDKSLLVIHDWINDLNFDPKAFASEKKVVLEEVRANEKLYDRLDEQMNECLFNNTIYSKRQAGGKANIVEEIDRDMMINFYNKWYTNKNQAIIILGDIDADAMEGKVKSIFSDIPKDDQYTPVPKIDIPQNKGTLYKHFKDQNIQNGAVLISYRTKVKEYKNIEDRKLDFYLDKIINTILKTRMSMFSEKDYMNTKSCDISFSKLTNDYYSYGIKVTHNKGCAKNALSNVLSLHKKMLQDGLSMDDIEVAVKVINQNLLIEQKLMPSIAQMRDKFIDNFMTENVITGPNNEFKLFEKIFPKITLASVNHRFRELASEHNKCIFVMTNGDEHLTKEEIESIEKNVEPKKLSDFLAEEMVELSFTNNELSGSTIIEDENIKEIKVQRWKLKNGANVYYKRTLDKSIQITARSLGGYSLLNEKEQEAAKQFTKYTSIYGLAGMDEAQITKYLRYKKVGMQFNIGDYYESVIMYSSIESINKAFETLYSFFEEPYFDLNQYNQLAIPDHEKISFDNLVNIYKNRFNNASDFNFFVLGDVSKKEAKLLVEKYIGSISSNDIHESYKEIDITYPNDTLILNPQITKGRTQNIVQLHVKKDCDHKDAVAIKMINDYLSMRLTALLRMKLHGTYEVQTLMNVSNKAYKQITCTVAYECDEKIVHQLNRALKEEFKVLAEHGMDKESFKLLKNKYSSLIITADNRNDFYNMVLMKYVEDDLNITNPEYIVDEVEKMDLQYINDLINSVFVSPYIKDIRQ